MLNNKSSILIVEDNIIVQDSLKKLLSEFDASITCANNGAVGLDLVKKNRFDLIICDLLMPKVDGFEFCKHIKDPEYNLQVPIVVLTSLDDKDEINRVREMGVDDVVLKPYDPNVLMSIVKGKISRVSDIKNSIEKELEKNTKRLFHTLSHEFRTRLLSIQSTSELLLERGDRLDSAKVNKLLCSIEKGSKRLERLINDFMILQQLEVGIHNREVEKKSQLFNLKTVVEDTVNNFKKSLESTQNIEIKIIDCSCGVNVKIHEIYFKNIIERILDNAIKFSNEEVNIDIYLLKELNNAVIEISDRGLGFDNEKAADALKLFTQINRETGEQQGSGSGLFICSEYIKAHGGKIEIQSREGGGTTVRITIPCE